MATHFPLDGETRSATDGNLPPGAIERHALVDRLFHWLTAAIMFVLLGTGLLPVAGIRFEWLEIHWIAGTALTAAVLFHVVRSLLWQRLAAIWLHWRDLRELTGGQSPGKYTLAQKLMHHAFTVALLAAIATGVLLLKKIQTPFFERDPYLFTERTWGILHVVHDAAALLAVLLVIVHVYFALLPEKRFYLRAMIKGWITREELREHHAGGQHGKSAITTSAPRGTTH
jgi:cytochrome b subunit of formate dehydrogenase